MLIHTIVIGDPNPNKLGFLLLSLALCGVQLFFVFIARRDYLNAKIDKTEFEEKLEKKKKRAEKKKEKEKKPSTIDNKSWWKSAQAVTREAACQNAGVTLACECVIANETPDDTAVAACKALGAALV